jgi:hypothetical protein
VKAYTFTEEDFEKLKRPIDPKELAAIYGGGAFFVNLDDEKFRWGTCSKNSITLRFDEPAMDLALAEFHCADAPNVNEEQDYQDQAILYLLSASRILYMKGRGARFTKAELKAEAQRLWACTRCRARGTGSNLENELARVRKFGVNWPRLYRWIGLKGVKNAKRGRKPRPKL